MKYLSALFLVVLIAPFAYSFDNIIEMVQKSDEGREVLENIYLETGLYGGNLNVKSVTGRLRTISSTARQIRKSFNAARKQNNAECKKTLGSLSARFHSFVNHQAQAGIYLKQYVKAAKGVRHTIARARLERLHQQKFETMASGMAKGWATFWKRTSGNVKRAGQLVERLRTQISRLHRKNNRAALVELPADYTNAVTEVETEFIEKVDDNLNGVKPIINNLIQIAKNKKHLRNKKTRKAVRGILERLSEFLHDSENAFVEENEHQKVIFSEIVSLYKDRADRSSRHLKGLVSYAKVLDKKIGWFRATLKHAKGFVTEAKNIVDLKVQECANVNNMVNVNTVRLTRVIESCSQVLEVVTDRFGDVKKAVKQAGKK